MKKQEYQHIRNLAWDLLIDSNASKLPININNIASLYNLQGCINHSLTRFDNTLVISQKILQIFGYNHSHQNSKILATRLLAPMIVFKAIGIKSANDIFRLTELPYELSLQRFDRYQMLLKRNAFCISNLEKVVLRQFASWIESLNS